MNMRTDRYCVVVMVVLSLLTGCRSGGLRASGYEATPAALHPITGAYDRLEASGDPELFRILQQPSPDSIAATLDWLQPRALAGRDPRYLYVYSYNLWRFGVRDTAFAMWLAAGLHAAVDASKCKDPSAPRANISPWERLMQPVAMAYEGERSEVRHRYLDLAVMIEQRNGARGPNAWICSGGVEYYLQYFKRHPQEKGEVVHDGRSIGEVRKLPPDPDIKPEFTDSSEWEQARQDAVQEFVGIRR